MFSLLRKLGVAAGLEAIYPQFDGPGCHCLGLGFFAGSEMFQGLRS